MRVKILSVSFQRVNWLSVTCLHVISSRNISARNLYGCMSSARKSYFDRTEGNFSVFIYDFASF